VEDWVMSRTMEIVAVVKLPTEKATTDLLKDQINTVTSDVDITEKNLSRTGQPVRVYRVRSEYVERVTNLLYRKGT